MKLRLFKIFMLAAPLVLSLLTSAPEVDAQGGGCSINQASFRTTKPGGPSSPTFYQNSDRPFVYLDITTAGCNGQELEFSIEAQGIVDNNIDGLDDEPIQIGVNTNNQPAFTLVMKAGAENCSDALNPDCQYKILIEESDGDDIFYSSDIQELEYDISETGEDWSEILQIIPIGTESSLDPHANQANVDDVDTNPEAQQADDPNGESFIDLSIPNPVAGTIDNIPGLFQKIVDFAITIGIPLVAMAIVYSGFLFVTARGDSGQIDTAKSAFTAAVIGGLVLFAAWLVAAAIKDALLSI